MIAETSPSIGQREAIQAKVRQILSGACGFADLGPERQAHLIAATENVATFVASSLSDSRGLPKRPLPFQDLAIAVDFPAFVASLVEGVFNGMGNSVSLQMQAYVELIGALARLVEHATKSTVEPLDSTDI